MKAKKWKSNLPSFRNAKNQQMNEFRELFLALHIYEQGQFYQSLDEKTDNIYTITYLRKN